MFRILPFLFLSTAPALAQISAGTKSGVPYAVRSYAITSPSGSALGSLVATEAGSGIWYEDTEYWFWSKGTGFPSGGFVLKVGSTTPAATLNPDKARQLTNDDFPARTGTCTTSGSGWFRVERSGTVLGYAREAGSDGIYWYILGDNTGAAQTKYPLASTTSGAEYLRFVALSAAPGTLSNCAAVHSPLEYAP